MTSLKVHRLHDGSIYTAVVSNADSRMRTYKLRLEAISGGLSDTFHYYIGSVLRDLEFPAFLRPIVLSEEEGIEKPSPEIFLRALHRINAEITSEGGRKVIPAECIHVGDDIIW